MLKFPLDNGFFTCDHLKTLEQFLLQGFEVLPVFDSNGEKITLSGLQNIIQNNLSDAENKDELRTYLIKDKETKEVACLFSLKTGSLIFDNKTDNFHEVIPAIELAYFAFNKCYREKHPKSKGFGASFFDVFVTDIVKEIYDLAGCSYLYVFAINHTKLIKTYLDLDFEELPEAQENEVVKNISADTTEGCKFLYKNISTM